MLNQPIDTSGISNPANDAALNKATYSIPQVQPYKSSSTGNALPTNPSSGVQPISRTSFYNMSPDQQNTALSTGAYAF